MRRQRLIDRLSFGLLDAAGTFARRLTLVSAPAGTGKTTLISDWLQGIQSQDQARMNVAWLSLDEDDDDPARFSAYLLAACQQAGLDLEPATAALLRSPQPLPPESVGDLLINQLSAADTPTVLTLDDYHHITSSHIHDLVARFLTHSSPQLHLVIMTREDPPFSVARLRGRGQLLEVRQADLYFTLNETATFLNQVMGLDLGAAEIQVLEERTEGWIAGLQLAALALQGSFGDPDRVGEFVQSFAGSNRYVLDYLIEEVFQRLPDATQSFLLQTVVLDRLSGPLCAAVTDREDSQEMLESLEAANLFLIPLDDRRRWYRYHRLFADLLRYRAQQEGLQNAIFHDRASRWYEKQGYAMEAIGHALAAQEWEWAAGLIERDGEHLLGMGQVVTLLKWIELLPRRVIETRPALCDTAGWALAIAGRLEAAERFADLLAIAGEQNEVHLTNSISLRAYVARARHDVTQTITLSQQALALLPADDYQARCVLGTNLGVAYIYSGELAKAVELWTEAAQNAQRSANPHVRTLALSFKGQVIAAWGRLHEAAELQRQAISWGNEEGAAPTTARAHVNIAALLYERDDLTTADEHLRRAIELSELVGDRHARRDAYRVLGRLRQARGNTAGAMEALGMARELLDGADVGHSARLLTAATHARVALSAGNVALATRCWADAGDIAPDADVNQFELLANAGCLCPQLAQTQVRLLLALQRQDDAFDLATRCCAAAEALGFNYSLVNARLLQALAAPDRASASDYLASALALAKSEGYLRSFLDEGEPMNALLADQATPGSMPHTTYATALLKASRNRQAASPEFDHMPSASPTGVTPLLDPLSERELEVLRLLARHQSNAQMSRALHVSVNTIKTHLRHIYEKLGVHDRWAAVRRAQEMDLLS